MPWLGDVPVLGALFRSAAYQKKETDLAIIVTPRLVQPARPGDVLKTPLDNTCRRTTPTSSCMAGQSEITPAEGGLPRAGVAPVQSVTSSTCRKGGANVVAVKN